MFMLPRPTTLNGLRPSPVVDGLVHGCGNVNRSLSTLNLHAGAPPGAAKG